MKTDNTVYRSAAGVALAAAFVLVWMVLAVGVVGRAGARAGDRYPSWQRPVLPAFAFGLQLDRDHGAAPNIGDSFPWISLHGL